VSEVTKPLDLTQFEGHTAGMWRWRIHCETGANVAQIETPHSGRLLVMDCVRWGMTGAAPRLAVWRDGEPRGSRNSGIMHRMDEIAVAKDHNGDCQVAHPDALLIAAAPALLAEVKRLLALAHAVAELGHKGAESAELEYDRAQRAYEDACDRLYELEDTDPFPWR
jgi:hypothetical protein